MADVTLLDWRDRRHWGGTPLACRICGTAALLRDESGRPCHKVCADAEALEAAFDPESVSA